MALAIQLYDIVLAIHILAVVVAFGVVFAYPLIDAQFRAADPPDLAGMHRLHLKLSTRLITPAMTVVLIAGLYLALDRFSLGDPWISITFTILLAIFAIVGAILTPADRKLVELAERDRASGGGPSDEYTAELAKANAVGTVALLLVVAAIVVMTVKPGL